MNNIKNLRISVSFTQAEMADRLGMSRSGYANIEAGKREPDFSTLFKLADYFGVSLDYLLGRESPAASDADSGSALSADSQHLNAEEQAQLALYRSLGKKDREQAVSYMSYLREQARQSESAYLDVGGAAVDMEALGYAAGLQIKSNPVSPETDGAALEDQLISRLCGLTPEDVLKVDAFVQGMLRAR